MLCPSNLNRRRGTEKRNFSRIRYKHAVSPAKSRFTAIFLSAFWALLASLWVGDAAFLSNQAIFWTFDFRLGSRMRIFEHTRYAMLRADNSVGSRFNLNDDS